MGRLAGFSYRDIVRRLKELGVEFHRQAAGSHEIWYNPALKRYTTIPNHPGDMPRARCAPFSSRPASTRMRSSNHNRGIVGLRYAQPNLHGL